MIIEIEGIDGAGKTTQCQILKEELEGLGYTVKVVKELEGTIFGQKIKHVLTSNECKINRKAEMFSFLACKAQLLSQVVVPFIDNDKWVLFDRGNGSFISYFSVLGVNRDYLLDSLRLVNSGVKASHTILLDLPAEIAIMRKDLKAKKSKFDSMGEEFFRRQRAEFQDLAKMFNTWSVIDGTLPIENVHCEIKQIISKLKVCN